MLRMLERMLPAFHEREQPLSVIRVSVREPSRSTNRRLARVLRRELWTADLVGELWGRGLLIVLPDTDRPSAANLCTDLAGLLASVGEEQEVGSMETATADSSDDLDQLLKWLRVGGLGVLGRGRELARNGVPLDCRGGARRQLLDRARPSLELASSQRFRWVVRRYLLRTHRGSVRRA